MTDLGDHRAHARRHVLSAAAAALAENPAASMQDIAAASGIGRATVYRWFATREQLIDAIQAQVVAEAGEIILRRLDEDGDALAVLNRLSVDILDLGDRYRFLESREPKSDEEERLTRRIEQFVATRQRAGELRADLSPEWIAAAYGGLVVAAIEHFTQHGGDRRETTEALARTVSAAFAP